jgi:hypothetical protein
MSSSCIATSNEVIHKVILTKGLALPSHPSFWPIHQVHQSDEDHFSKLKKLTTPQSGHHDFFFKGHFGLPRLQSHRLEGYLK